MECCQVVLQHMRNGQKAETIMGWSVDAVKLYHSASTFFLAALSQKERRNGDVVRVLSEMLAEEVKLSPQWDESMVGSGLSGSLDWRKRMGISCAFGEQSGDGTYGALSEGERHAALEALACCSMRMAQRWR